MDIREKILNDRENRMNLIKDIINKYNKFVICIKCNVCGDEKNFVEFEFVKKYFLNKVLNSFDVITTDYYESLDGNFYLVTINENDFEAVKRQLVNLESELLGRFVDLDLYTNLEKSITRSDMNLPERSCIVCDGVIASCMRNKTHSVDEVLEITRNGIKSDLVQLVCDISKQSMIEEVSAHPKFGLVTKLNSGKHEDMDYYTFIKSIDAMYPYLFEYANCGFNINEESFLKLREIGLRCERAMFDATNGINTHKGTIFILGFLLPSLVDAIYNNKSIEDASNTISNLAKDILNDFSDINKPKTVGEEMYSKYRITGIRGEVLGGLNKSFEAAKLFEYTNLTNEVVIDLIAYFMSCLDDTVILHSKDLGLLEYVKFIGKEVIDAGGSTTVDGMKLVEEYTADFISKNISPGGSADMTIASIILIELRKMFY